MAKKKKLTLDDMSLDNDLDLDFGDFDFDLTPPKDDRKPITKVKDGVVKGVKSTFTNPSFLAKVMKGAMPKEFGAAFDMADQASAGIRDLYNSAEQELRPVVKDMKKVTNKLTSVYGDKIPDKMKKRLEEWSKDDSSGSSSGYDPQESMIATSLAQIFATKDAADTQRENERKASDAIQETVERKRFEYSFKQLNDIRMNVGALAAYQQNIGANFQRKSLELQYRNYFALAELLNETKRSNLETRKEMKSLIHNSALPDYVKMQSKEFLAQTIRNKFANSIQQGLFGDRKDFVKTLTEKLVKKGKDKIVAFRDAAMGHLAQADMGADALKMGDDFGGGLDLHEMAGDMIGSGLAEKYGVKFAAWVRKKMESNPEVMKKANKTAYIAQNLPQLLKEYSNSETKQTGWRGAIVSGAKSLLRDTFNTKTTLERDSVSSMQQPAVYNRQTQRTLTEIIPGYLARMYRELQIIRTGNDKIDLLAFDHEKGRFGKEAEIRNQVVKSMLSGSARDTINRQGDDLVDKVDTNKTLNGDQREALKKMLLQDNADGKIFSKKRLSDSKSYSGEYAEHGEAFSKLFGDYFKDDTTNHKQLTFSAAANDLGNSINIDYAKLQNLVNLGYGSVLEDAGIIDQLGRVNERSLLDMYMREYEDIDIDYAEPGILRFGGNKTTNKNIKKNKTRKKTKNNNQVNILNQLIFGRPTSDKKPKIKPRQRPKPGSMAQTTFADISSQSSVADKKPGTALVVSHQVPQPGAAHVAESDNNVHPGNCDCFAAIVKAIEEHSVKTETMQIRDMLGAIGMMLTKGIRVYPGGLPGQTTTGGGADHFGEQTTGNKYDEFRKAATKGAAGFKNFFRNQWDKAAKFNKGKTKDNDKAGAKTNKPWYTMSMGEFIGNAFQGAGHLLAKGTEKAAQLKNKLSLGANWLKDKGLQLGGIGLEKGKALRKELKTRALDIYIEGRKHATMTAEKIREGEYIDVNTGKVITCVQDITGDVCNKAGELVMTADEAKKAYVRGTIGVRALRTLIKLKNKVDDIFGDVKGLAGLGLQIGKKLLQMGQDKLMDSLDKPVDVYVKGNLVTPVLTAIMMRGGNYRSKLTGRVISRPSQIDGVIVNADGEVVLTEDQIKKGLVNYKGQPLKTGLGRIGQLLGDAFKSTFKVARFAKNALHSAVDGVGNFFKGLIGPDGLVFAGGKKILKAVEEIRDILKERLPVNKKIRKGSVEDINAQRKEEEEKAEKKAAADKESSSSKGYGILAGLKSLFGKKDKDKDKDDDDDGKSSLLDKFSDIADLFGGKKGKLRRGLGWLKKGGKSLLRGGGNLIKGGLKIGARGLGGIGRGLLGMGGLFGGGSAAAGAAGAAEAAAAAGGVGAGAGTAATATGLALAGETAAAGGLAAGAGTAAAGAGAAAAAGTAGAAGAASAGGGILAGIASLLSAPVLIGAAAVAAVGIGGYMAYKYFKNKLSTIDKVRFTQYGFLPDENKYFGLIKKLEENCTKCLEFEGGVASISEKGLKVKDIADDFGVDLKDKKQVMAFIKWFRGRFKPVFLTHMTALIKTNRQIKTLSDVDKLSPEEKLKYLNLAHFKEGPYNMMEGPSPDIPKLKADAKVVEQAYQEAVAEVTKDKEKKTDKKGATSVTKAGAVPAAGSAAAAIKAKAADPKAPGQKTESLADVLNKDAGKGNFDYSTIGKDGMKSGLAMVTVGANAEPLAQAMNGRIDALSAIRFKAYGLNDMDATKVQALAALEKEVQKSVKLNGAKKAEWQGALEEIANSKAASFGVETTDKVKLGLWTRWFKARFLPVYLNFVTVSNSVTGKLDPLLAMQNMKPEDQVKVAVALIGSSGDGGSPVWAVPFSPWPGYKVNQSISSTDQNLSGLKAQMSKSKIDEQKGKNTGNEAKKDAMKATAENAAGGDQKKDMSLMDRMSSGIKSGWDAVKNAGSSVLGAAASAVDGATNAIKSGISSAVDAVGGLFGGGNAVSHPGNGTGGDINKLPSIKADGSYAGVKDLLDAASKMVGVDPKLMAVMAAIESSFKTKAKAKTSTATGLFQFISGTWKDMLKKYGAKYGIAPGTPASDPKANALMGAEFLKENANALKGVKSQLTDTDLYLAHFLGPGGARMLLGMGSTAIPANHPKMRSAALANKSIFFEGKNGEGRARTTAEVYQEVNRRVRSRARMLGVESGAAPAGSQAVKASPASKTTTPPAQQAQAAKKTAPPTSQLAESKPPVGAVPAAMPRVNSFAETPNAPTATTAPAATPALDNASNAGYAAAATPVAATSASKRSNNVTNLAPLTDLMSKSVSIQSDSYKVLVDILKALNSNGAGRATGAAGKTGNKVADTINSVADVINAVSGISGKSNGDSQDKNPTRNPTELPKSVISVAKGTF